MIEMEQSKSNFDPLTETFDCWYNTAEGAMFDHLEKKAVADAHC